jgi:hypothetical protein
MACAPDAERDDPGDCEDGRREPSSSWPGITEGALEGAGGDGAEADRDDGAHRHTSPMHRFEERQLIGRNCGAGADDEHG